jgi:hypothetical protein
MRIEFERSGGFMGLHQTVTLDTDTLEPQEALEIHQLVESAGFFKLSEKPADSSQTADQFQYRLTIEQSKDLRHTVVTSDASAPEALQPLLRRLTLLARTRRG